MILLEVGVIHLIKVENVDVWGFEGAIRGMRNPMNSWDKSDSDCITCCRERKDADCADCKLYIGPADLKLMRQLAKAGTDHSKFLRMIHVQFDLTAPLYWWKQFDQYKVGVTTDSTSTMHKIHDKEFTLDDFSHEHLHMWRSENGGDLHSGMADSLRRTIKDLNYCRNRYLEMRDKNWWWQMIQLLPSTYNQLRTVDTNYQALWAMYQARKNHKLTEWVDLCKEFENLPYFREIFLEE